MEAVMDARNRKYDGSGRTQRDAEVATQVMSEFMTLSEAWLKPRLKALRSK
jgi:hypothetical protein